MELAKTQAEGTEVIVGTTDEERGLNMINGMVEKRDYTEEDLEMEIEAINATLLENGDDMEEEEEFQTLSEEEAEQASRAQVLSEHALEEEKMVNGEADGEKGTGPEVGATKQGNRKRLYKPSISTAGSTKMRLASALLSPRKRAAAKMGPRQGDSSKPPESKGWCFSSKWQEGESYGAQCRRSLTTWRRTGRVITRNSVEVHGYPLLGPVRCLMESNIGPKEGMIRVCGTLWELEL
ncbi:hypothetical protein HID58_014444 [Brassica napus]|uniref:Uncharacterized protein n=1 Tax=Brassica napus TaxID=3708 RepID=A0ABQ8DI53_BRANA|nr:hypothetical protein HID58_014444 [Brassica napus]